MLPQLFRAWMGDWTSYSAFLLRTAPNELTRLGKVSRQLSAWFEPIVALRSTVININERATDIRARKALPTV